MRQRASREDAPTSRKRFLALTQGMRGFSRVLVVYFNVSSFLYAEIVGGGHVLEWILRNTMRIVE